ncbi:MAG: hypothetical protein ACI8UR_001066 [Natronomonas sp.]|jgi:hypothetical protein|uniref:hypothetical protein n=1 Tax=Natronomonas sp. TaxID=2184060 RepID=UPI0039894FE1
MERRSILAAVGTMLGGITAGCSRLSTDDRTEEYVYGLYNYSDKSRSFTIQIKNTSSGIIHTKTAQLEGGKATEPDSDDEITFEGDPVRILVQVDSSEKENLPWPASSSAEGKIATSAEISYGQENEGEISVHGL